MTEEALSQEIEKILLIIKNPELAVRMAEARIDGKYVLWKQAHVDYANQETGCTITLDDIDYCRDLMANKERTTNNAEIEAICSQYRTGCVQSTIQSPKDKERLKILFERNRIIQNGLAARYHHLSAFQSA